MHYVHVSFSFVVLMCLRSTLINYASDVIKRKGRITERKVIFNDKYIIKQRLTQQIKSLLVIYYIITYYFN